MNVVQPGDSTELKEALAVLVARPGLSSADVNHQIDVLLRYTQKRGISLEHCLMAKDQGRIIGTCLCLDSPGRTSSVFIPATMGNDAVGGAVVGLLDEASSRAARRDIQLLQGLVRPEADREARVYRKAGFQLLAQLICLESDLTQRSVLSGRPTPPVSWETYSPKTHELFARVVQGTYQGSLDCGSLNGLRTIEDILASHRATGEFDPRFWLLALGDEGPVGTILLSYVPERPAYEVVYMGLLPQWRRRGYGTVLLRRGVQMARDQAAMMLTLAVDARNTPAQRLYRRFGFREVSRRDVWVRILSKPDSPSEASPIAAS